MNLEYPSTVQGVIVLSHIHCDLKQCRKSWWRYFSCTLFTGRKNYLLHLPVDTLEGGLSANHCITYPGNHPEFFRHRRIFLLFAAGARLFSFVLTFDDRVDAVCAVHPSHLFGGQVYHRSAKGIGIPSICGPMIQIDDDAGWDHPVISSKVHVTGVFSARILESLWIEQLLK